MKTIHTAGFGIANRLPANHPQVSIARYSPMWWKPPGGRRLYERRLAPSKALLDACKAGATHDEWTAAYRQEILDAGQLAAIIDALPDGCVMLCWEKAPHDCHRQVAWDLLHEQFGISGGEMATEKVAHELSSGSSENS